MNDILIAPAIPAIPAPLFGACQMEAGTFAGNFASNFDAVLQLMNEPQMLSPQILEHLQTVYGVEIAIAEEDFANMEILAAEMEIKAEDVPHFEALIINLLKSGLITGEDLAEAIEVPIKEFPDGSIGIEQSPPVAERSRSPIRNVLEVLWSGIKEAPEEIKEEELPQEFEKIAEEEHFVKVPVKGRPQSAVEGRKPKLEHIELPVANIAGIKVALRPIKILNHNHVSEEPSEEPKVHRVRGSIDIPQKEEYLPKEHFNLEIDFEAKEFAVWVNDKETDKPEIITKGELFAPVTPVETRHALSIPLVSILQKLYEKYLKHAKKEEGESEETAAKPEIKVAINNDLRNALIKGDEVAIKEALSKGADLNEAIKYEPPAPRNFFANHAPNHAQNIVPNHAPNLMPNHEPVHAMVQIPIEQELERDESLVPLFRILKNLVQPAKPEIVEKPEIVAAIEPVAAINRAQPLAAIEPLAKPEPVEEEAEIIEEELEVAPKKPQKPLARQQPEQQQPPTQLQQPNAEPIKPREQKRATPPPIAQVQTPIHVQVQPEIRAVFEGSDLKIEAFDPKTGDKLQTVSTRVPHAMQERIHEFEVVKQVIAQAKLITTPTGDQRMTLQLRPEHLGQVDMRITLSHNEMQIQARVESPVAQAALETHIGLLREGLEKQGITLDRLEVSVEQKDKQDAFSLAERQDREEQREQQRNRNRRAKAQHLAVSITKNDPSADTGRRLGYNSMEYLA